MPMIFSRKTCRYIGDAVPAIFIAVVLFCLPNEIPRLHKVEDTGKADALLDWPIVHKKYPWSIIFLMGGGFALAEACEVIRCMGGGEH